MKARVREGLFTSFVIPHNDRLNPPASSVLDQLASNESASAEDNDKDADDRTERQ